MAALAAFVFAAPLTSAPARQLAAEEGTFVEVEVAGVGITTTGVPAVLLRPPDTQEVIPIFIGVDQARAIVLALRGAEPSRPMTHDLLNNTLGALESHLERVYVDDVRDNTFYGMLELTVAGHDTPVRVDSRPSDALALALRAEAAILVSPRVLEAAENLDYHGMAEKIARAAGITVNAVSDRLRQALSLPDTPGVVVSAATGPAARAGLRPGALITAVNGEAAASPERFRELLGAIPAGEKAAITFWQDGDTRRIEVPAQLPDARQAAVGTMAPA
jgi:bifunctional DNase/RNase